MIDRRLLDEYETAIQASGIIRLANWTTVRLTGADRASFLHNMCTNDIRNLPLGGQCEAFLTDVKGKIIGHVIVLAEPEQLTLISVPDQAERLIGHLDRYIIREDVRLADDSARVAWSITVGPNAHRAVDGSDVPDPARTGRVLFPCQQIWTGGSWVGNDAKAPLVAENASFCDARVWHMLRTESGWPLFGVDFDGSNLAQEAGRDVQAINLRKGCYLGQETVARIDALGHVNRRLAAVRLADDLSPGGELTAGGVVVGHVTSTCWSPRLDSWIGLAMLRRGFNEPGAALTCGDIAASVIETPPVRPSLPAA